MLDDNLENQKEEEKSFEGTQLRYFGNCLSEDAKTEFMQPIGGATKKKVSKKAYDLNLRRSLRKLLNSKYCETEDGEITIADKLTMSTVAFVLQNPTPQNLQLIAKVAGEEVVNVNVGGSGIEDFIKNVMVDDANKK